MESLAIFERGYLYPSPGSIAGVNSDCPYCIARHISDYRINDLAVMLQASSAGRLLRYKSSNADGVVDQFEWLDDPTANMRLMREHWLTLPIEALTVPFWLPKLSLRNCFVIDEVAVWFCSESAAGTGFHWDDDRLIEIARTLWHRRLPILPTELSKVLLAHGMPEQYQATAEHLFQFAVSTLVATHRRPALKKLRSELPAEQFLYETWKLK
jgi:hypothetical protein